MSEGLKLSDFEQITVDEKPKIRMNYRVLKRGSYKTRVEGKPAHVDINLADPFAEYVVKWLNWLLDHNREKVFDITRFRAWQIIHDIDSTVWVH